MTIKLREYQQQAVNKALWAMSLNGNDMICLPTGAGKSIVIAELARSLNRPILILQPSKEILEQNMSKLALYVERKEIGVYSASMNRKDIARYTFATIQSIYKKPKEFVDFGIALIDEAHLVNPKNLTGMFTSFLTSVAKLRGANMKCFGLTATPYRNVTGYHQIEVPHPFYKGQTTTELEASLTLKLVTRMRPLFWNRLLYNVNNRDLVKEGFLCPLRYIKNDLFLQEELKTNKSKSDFDLADVENRMLSKRETILETIRLAQMKYKSVLVFTTSIHQAQDLSKDIAGSQVVTGKTDKKRRDWMIHEFKKGAIKTMFNMGVLTTGFDHPELDCIVLLRPTRSLALYYQMLGRGVRIADGKTECTIIDFTNSVEKLGTVESIEMRKDVSTNNKWELFTDASLFSWHGRSLYTYTMAKKTKEVDFDEMPPVVGDNDLIF